MLIPQLTILTIAVGPADMHVLRICIYFEV